MILRSRSVCGRCGGIVRVMVNFDDGQFRRAVAVLRAWWHHYTGGGCVR